MIVVYGLGNNEQKYVKTKHNLGRIVVEKIAHQLELAQFQKKNSFYYTKSSKICCAYSTGYMNESGTPLAQMLSYFNFSANNNNTLILIHDDSDMQEGTVKLALGGGHAGHNGVASVYSAAVNFGYEASHIWRLKIGIRPQQNLQRSETFVLSQISKTDEETCEILAKKLHQNWSLAQQNEMEKLQTIINSSFVALKN